MLTRSLLRAMALAGLALAFFAGGCTRFGGPSGPVQKLTIAEASQPPFVLLYVADAKGFFKEAGLEVTFNSFVLGRDALASVLEGKADLATAWDPAVVAKIYEGEPLGIISTLHTANRGTTVVARRDRGITVPADLAGKRIGVTPVSTEYFLSVFFATHGVAPQSVTHVPLEPDASAAALLRGEVDGVVAFNPYKYQLADALGERGVALYTDAYVDISMLVGRRDTIVARPEAMARLLKAVTRAQDYVERNKEESIRIVVARLAGKFSENVIRSGWDEFTAEARLDHRLISAMRMQAIWLKDRGRYENPVPDFRAAIAAGPLRGVRPEAVTIVGGS